MFTYINIIVVVLSKLRETARHVQRQNLRLEYCTLLIAEIRKTIQDRKDLKQKGMCATIEE